MDPVQSWAHLAKVFLSILSMELELSFLNCRDSNIPSLPLSFSCMCVCVFVLLCSTGVVTVSDSPNKASYTPGSQ